MTTYSLLLFLAALLFIVVMIVAFYLRPRRLRKKMRQGLFFDSSLGEIFYTRWGKKRKPSVLLIHGLGASGFCWRLLIPLLQDHFDIINIDLWGFGRSHKDPERKITLEDHLAIFSELLNHLKIKRTHVIGCSMGGAIGMWFANQCNERVDKVVTLAPAAHPSLVPSYIQRIYWLSDWTPLVVSRSLIQTLLYGVYANKELITEDAVDEYYRPYLDKRAHRTFAHHLELIQDHRVYNSLPTFEHDTLTLWGTKDATVPQNIMQDIVRKLPNTQYQVHPSGGHHLMEEDPKWCAEQIIPFLRSKPV